MFILKPFSPHLLIYNFQLSSLTSILHRISSLVIIIFLIFLVLYYFSSWNIFLFNYLIFNKYLYISSIFLKYFFLNVSLFHILNGIKIIFWNFVLIQKDSILNIYNKLVILLFLIFILV